jgi:hypothetical protein
MALMNNPSLTGTFRVDVLYLGSGLPGAQLFFFNQLDANGGLVQLASGNTATVDLGTPEPAGWTLAGAGFLMGGLVWAVRRRWA